MTYFPPDASHPAVLLSLYQTAPPLVVTVTEPSALVTVDNPLVAGEISSGVQTTRRVRIFDPDGVTLIYDLGPTATAAQSVVAATLGALHTGVTGYVARLDVENDEGLFGVGTLLFDTLFQPSVAVTGVRLTELGDKCNIGRTAELPGVRVQWNQITPGVGEVFQSYSVLRRAAGSTVWTTATTITSIETTSYIDYSFSARTAYEYAVVWTAQNGTDVLVSLPQATPLRASVDFDWTFLHDSIDPRNWVAYYSLDQEEDVQSDRKFNSLGTRQQPTAFIGEAQYATFRLTGLPDVYGGDVWDASLGLFTRQRTAGSTIVVRNGKAGLLKFCTFSRMSRALGQAQYSPDVELIETFYDESSATT